MLHSKELHTSNLVHKFACEKLKDSMSPSKTNDLRTQHRNLLSTIYGTRLSRKQVRGRLMDHLHPSKRVESMWGNMRNNFTVNIKSIFKSIRKFFPRLNAVAEKERGSINVYVWVTINNFQVPYQYFYFILSQLWLLCNVAVSFSVDLCRFFCSFLCQRFN